MNVWEFMEMIHSRSYTYIIKNVYPNTNEVFDTILKDEQILERATAVTSAYDDFINAAHQFDNSNELVHALEGVDAALTSRYELKRKLFRAVSTVNIPWKELGSMSPSHAALLLESLSLWKDRQKLLVSSPGMRINTW